MSALIWCPFPDQESAAAVADALLEERLIACANFLGTMHSHYVWNGEKGECDEMAVLFKTHSDCLESAVARIESLHPYETPAILGWHCEAVGAATLGWLGGLPRSKG